MAEAAEAVAEAAVEAAEAAEVWRLVPQLALPPSPSAEQASLSV